MIVQVSEKHAEGKYGETISDKELIKETLAKCAKPDWWKFILMGGYDKTEVCYVDIMEGLFWPQPPYSTYKAFKKNTVITFTQDKLS